jgi:hypothetical protein
MLNLTTHYRRRASLHQAMPSPLPTMQDHAAAMLDLTRHYPGGTPPRDAPPSPLPTRQGLAAAPLNLTTHYPGAAPPSITSPQLHYALGHITTPRPSSRQRDTWQHFAVAGVRERNRSRRGHLEKSGPAGSGERAGLMACSLDDTCYGTSDTWSQVLGVDAPLPGKHTPQPGGDGGHQGFARQHSCTDHTPDSGTCLSGGPLHALAATPLRSERNACLPARLATSLLPGCASATGRSSPECRRHRACIP